MTGANPTLEDLQIFLNENFDFRYNVLTDMPECKPKNTNTYRMIDKRMMNSLSYKAMMMGVDCKDADVKRFLFSDQIATHHPFKDYLDTLPEWDRTDRVTPVYTVHNFSRFFTHDVVGVRAYQIVRHRDRSITINLVAERQYNSDVERMTIDFWQQRLGVPVNIVVVDEIPLMHNNKRLTIVNE